MIKPSTFRNAVQANQKHYDATRKHNQMRTTTTMRLEQAALNDVMAANAQVFREMGIDPDGPVSVRNQHLLARLLEAINRVCGTDWSKVYS